MNGVSFLVPGPMRYLLLLPVLHDDHQDQCVSLFFFLFLDLFFLLSCTKSKHE